MMLSTLGDAARRLFAFRKEVAAPEPVMESVAENPVAENQKEID